jgi:hypothetical protein
VICLVSGSLRSVAPSQKPARFVRIQHLRLQAQQAATRKSAISMGATKEVRESIANGERSIFPYRKFEATSGLRPGDKRQCKYIDG